MRSTREAFKASTTRLSIHWRTAAATTYMSITYKRTTWYNHQTLHTLSNITTESSQWYVFFLPFANLRSRSQPCGLTDYSFTCFRSRSRPCGLTDYSFICFRSRSRPYGLTDYSFTCLRSRSRPCGLTDCSFTCFKVTVPASWPNRLFLHLFFLYSSVPSRWSTGLFLFRSVNI